MPCNSNRNGRLGGGADGAKGGISGDSVPNQSRNRSAASRSEQRSMLATRSSTVPPSLPPRASKQEIDWQHHRLRATFTEKLSWLLFEVCVGNGHCPRNSPPLLCSLMP